MVRRQWEYVCWAMLCRIAGRRAGQCGPVSGLFIVMEANAGGLSKQTHRGQCRVIRKTSIQYYSSLFTCTRYLLTSHSNHTPLIISSLATEKDPAEPEPPPIR